MVSLDHTAAGTGLTGISGVNGQQRLTGPFCLVSQLRQHHSPTLRQDFPVQSGFLFDPLPGIFHRAFSRAGHTLDRQGFGKDPVVLPHQSRRDTVNLVANRDGFPGFGIGKLLPDLQVFPGGLAPRPFQAELGLAIPAGHRLAIPGSAHLIGGSFRRGVQGSLPLPCQFAAQAAAQFMVFLDARHHRIVAGGNQGMDAPIDANHCPGGTERLLFNRIGQGNRQSPLLAGDFQRFRLPLRQRPLQLDFNAGQAGQFDVRPLAVRSRFQPGFFIAARLDSAPAGKGLETGKSRRLPGFDPLKESGHGLVQQPKRPDTYPAADCPVFGHSWHGQAF